MQPFLFCVHVLHISSINLWLPFSYFFFLISTYIVPPEKPVIRNREGQELTSYEVGPFEVDQDIVLDCEVSGGNLTILIYIFTYKIKTFDLFT